MNSKIKTKRIIIAGVACVVWIIYFIQAYNLFSELSSFVTPGSSYIIKLLEFTNYRPSELSSTFIFYFILISLCTYVYSFIYSRTLDKKKILGSILTGYMVLFIILFFISNIFLPLYIILTVLSNLLIITSFYMANTLWGSKTTFDKDDVLFTSIAFDTERDANKQLRKLIDNSYKQHINDIHGEVFKDDNKFYFEISATTKITLDKKGEF